MSLQFEMYYEKYLGGTRIAFVPLKHQSTVFAINLQMKVAQTGVSSQELIQTPKFLETARCLKHGLFRSNFCIILHTNM